MPMSAEHYDRIRIEEIVTEREAMIAENKQREFQDQAMAYNEADFQQLSNRLHDLIW